MSDHLPFMFTFKCHTAIKVPEYKHYRVDWKNLSDDDDIRLLYTKCLNWKPDLILD